MTEFSKDIKESIKELIENIKNESVGCYSSSFIVGDYYIHIHLVAIFDFNDRIIGYSAHSILEDQEDKNKTANLLIYYNEDEDKFSVEKIEEKDINMSLEEFSDKLKTFIDW